MGYAEFVRPHRKVGVPRRSKRKFIFPVRLIRSHVGDPAVVLHVQGQPLAAPAFRYGATTTAGTWGPAEIARRVTSSNA